MAGSSNKQHLLRQLLDEDQEPFILKNYIDEKRYLLKRSSSIVPATKAHLQVKRRKPISEMRRKNSCFFSFHDSPDVKMSPLFSPIKSSPYRSPNINSNNTNNNKTLFVHIPSRTAALLLDAALRIQKQSVAKKPKNTGFGFFGTMLKRLTNRKRKNLTLDNDEIKVSVKDILRWDSTNGRKRITEEMMKVTKAEDSDDEIRASDMGFSCSCNNSRVSSAWSESNEEKSLDLETCSSRSDEDSDEDDFVEEHIRGDFCSTYEKEFCSSPFRFVLDNSSSPTGQITPEFRSPVSSPARLKKQVVESQEGELHCSGNDLEEEDEKEQFSPVSVLEPQFEEDDDEDEQEDEEEENDGSEMERSFANVHRARQQLLHKLRRFERLAELDPIELEKRIAEEEDDEEELYGSEGDDSEDEMVSDNCKGDPFVRQLLVETSLCTIIDGRIPSDMRRLVLDLMTEVEDEEECMMSPSVSPDDREMIMTNKLRKRLDSWKEVESNTIDMMVELDFRRESDKWGKNQEQVKETAIAIELDIFSYLVKELSEELVHSGHQNSL
ncbi:hypothetical protein MKW98_002259 [Papaver atlanticum]|uniref:DUF4378 domain-containing protein n=1 Tax=Papaver atlanticum TaxID=357466 RepID=A0AAD4RUJ3_9MAGN|nr:hypothetical protein MKW98_002259 [Papaver atlanticum]